MAILPGQSSWGAATRFAYSYSPCFRRVDKIILFSSLNTVAGRRSPQPPATGGGGDGADMIIIVLSGLADRKRGAGILAG